MLSKNKKYGCRTKTQVLTANGFITPDGFSSIVFRNIGSDEAKIFRDIPLSTGGEDYAVINREFVEITERISVTFDTTASPKVVVLMIYYDEYK